MTVTSTCNSSDKGTERELSLRQDRHRRRSQRRPGVNVAIIQSEPGPLTGNKASHGCRGEEVNDERQLGD